MKSLSQEELFEFFKNIGIPQYRVWKLIYLIYIKYVSDQKLLSNKNIRAFIRERRGNDILAACGQLKGRYDLKKRNLISGIENRKRVKYQKGIFSGGRLSGTYT